MCTCGKKTKIHPPGKCPVHSAVLGITGCVPHATSLNLWLPSSGPPPPHLRFCCLTFTKDFACKSDPKYLSLYLNKEHLFRSKWKFQETYRQSLIKRVLMSFCVLRQYQAWLQPCSMTSSLCQGGDSPHSMGVCSLVGGQGTEERARLLPTWTRKLRGSAGMAA